ncbi:IS4 family transposase, partial [Bacillus sp. FJAT-49711]|nr:IS4 family transposase [Bacillus sp. FJAT-49711]MBS4219574.1 IS4 family transposase [Bacillus sp. FJAT-49711]
SLLPATTLACPSHNYNFTKLSDESLVKIFLLSTLFRWGSLREIEVAIRSKKQIQNELKIGSISASQISRRLRSLDTAELSALLGRIAWKYWSIKSKAKGIHSNVGILRIIDSTFIKLPNQASDWTAVSKDSSGVKLHLCLAVASSDSVFPERMIPSTSNVADIDAVNHLIDCDDATYVMDRGYGEKTKIGGWLSRGVKFLVRVKKTFKVETLREYTPDVPNVTKHAKVSIRTRPERLKLVEFTDNEGTFFRILTNRLDLTEQEIMDTYKNRWFIEIFFKWLKQHIKVEHLFSHSPIGIWNQLFLSLITFGLLEILKLLKQPRKTAWQFLRILRQYLLDSWDEVNREFYRPQKRSKGRQKVPSKIPIPRIYGENVAIVSPISKDHYVKKEK